MSDQTASDVYGHLTMCNAVLILILNLFLPGVGTMLASRYVKTYRVLQMQ